jgi:hypothetical protein
MRDSYLEREIPTTIEEEHDDVNETYILGLTNDDIKFQVHIREEMVCNVERQCGDDQAYVEYPEELKQKGKKVTMKIISHTWRTYKSRLVKCWRNKTNLFNTYKDLREENLEIFVAKCELEDRVMNS